jgi:hypothetical protein
VTCLSGSTVIVYVTLAGGRAGLAAFSGREGVLRRFLDALALPVPPPWAGDRRGCRGRLGCVPRDKPGLVSLAWSRAMRTVTVKVLYS